MTEIRGPGCARLLFALCLSALSLTACNRESAREPGLEWNGAPLEVFRRTENPASEVLRAEGFPFLGEAPRRLLKAAPGEGIDSLTLLEFAGDVEAYAAFQELAAGPEDFAEGFALGAERVFFRRGRWIGSMRAWAWKGAPVLEAGLALPDAPAGTHALPAPFASLLQQGRREGSERVLTREFLGLPIEGRVFSAQLDCRGDTARIYASSSLTRAFGLQVAKRFAGSVDSTHGDLRVTANSAPALPLRLRFSGRGMVGVEGCFDESLTEFWIKMQTRGLKSLK